MLKDYLAKEMHDFKYVFMRLIKGKGSLSDYLLMSVDLTAGIIIGVIVALLVTG